MDNAGALIERVSYDPYGRPTIEAADPMAPMVWSVQREANGDLLVAFTEAVLPPPSTTAGTVIVDSLQSISGALTLLRDVSGTMTAVAGTWSYEESAAGFEHGTVLRFVPGEALAAGTAVQLDVNAGGLIDSWANGTSAVTLNFNIGAGVLYTGPPQGSTSTPVVERSLVGNALLFQSHLWDADAGLYLARARVLDPATGTFLQRDPSGYSDSVNLYAFTKSDPVNHRDPTGRAGDPKEPPTGMPAGAPGAAPQNQSVYTSGGAINYGSRAAHSNFSAIEQFNIDKLRFHSGMRELRRSTWFSWFSSPRLEEPTPVPPTAALTAKPAPPTQEAPIRVTTPNAAMRAEANRSGTYVDPLTNTVKPAPVEGLAADHIYPKSRIKQMQGFDRLTAEHQSEVLNHPFNTQGLPATFNSSKGARLPGEWQTYKDRPLHPSYVQTDRERAEMLEQFLRGLIRSRLEGGQ